MSRRPAAMLAVAVMVTGCLPAATVGDLAPTLSLDERAGVAVAMQNGIPVPSFGWQPRARIELDGLWQVERVALDPDLTMGDRDETLAAIEDEASGRHRADHPDEAWERLGVPGTTNSPPDGEEVGAWYRRAFTVPADWAGQAVTLRFGSANYVADVWVNGTWLGYHEGGRTPFAFDLGAVLRPGGDNVLAVRVHTIPLGTRSDMIPWGLIDWWNYGGLTGPAWLEAASPIHVVRADVRPHLDAVDVRVLVSRPGRLAGESEDVEQEPSPDEATLVARILPATVTEANLLDPDPRSLLAEGSASLVTLEQPMRVPTPGEVEEVLLTFQFGAADLWRPSRPALYVLQIEALAGERSLDAGPVPLTDTFWTTFGIRHVGVDARGPRVLLNGDPVFFRGVGLHGESIRFGPDGELVGGLAHQPPSEVLGKLRRAAEVGADLLRTGHEPADPTVLMLADRLGLAVWQEIPLYHATPAVFERTLSRG
ncbi:MAG: beta galactosidase jelly roll domain-containing protein, partial [Chloroflexi bacterium]|nr:beta galactosidase jelly roll domain-containing protein [Chloroflexota bacterium]